MGYPLRYHFDASYFAAIKALNHEFRALCESDGMELRELAHSEKWVRENGEQVYGESRSKLRAALREGLADATRD